MWSWSNGGLSHFPYFCSQLTRSFLFNPQQIHTWDFRGRINKKKYTQVEAHARSKRDQLIPTYSSIHLPWICFKPISIAENVNIFKKVMYFSSLFTFNFILWSFSILLSLFVKLHQLFCFLISIYQFTFLRLFCVCVYVSLMFIFNFFFCYHHFFVLLLHSQFIYI